MTRAIIAQVCLLLYSIHNVLAVILYFCMYLYPRKRSLVWGYTGFTLSVCLSVCLSVYLPPVCGHMILSTHVLRNGCMDFSKNLYTNYPPSEKVHLEFTYWVDNFSSLYRLFFPGQSSSFLTRNSILKIMKNFD